MSTSTTRPHIDLSTDELAYLEINGSVNVLRDGVMFAISADRLSVSLAELADPTSDTVAICGDELTVSA